MSDQHDLPTHDELVCEENLARLLAAGERPQRLSAERGAKMLCELQVEQRRMAQRLTAQGRIFDKERAMNDWAPASAFPWQSDGQSMRPPPLARHGDWRRHWAGSLMAAGLLLAFVIGAFRAGQSPDESDSGPAANALANKVEAERPIRKRLDDGTVVVAHKGARFAVSGPRELSLERGEIYIIVAKGDEPFIVRTPHGRAEATGTRFYVSTSPPGSDETRAAVAQGTVTLAGKGGSVSLQAGQEGLLPREGKPSRQPAPRLSHLVSWAKEVLAQDELLVTKPEPESGLIALDPWGQEVRLTLRKYHVDVYIEDGIARTTIDQTFFNHNPWNTEGTFYFPLPPDASVSRLAMYVSGKLNEGGMVPRIRGQQIYDEIRYQQRDPALLEMMEGNVFKMRIFPLEGRQEKRIFLSYTQKLPELYGTLRYWFPMDHTHHVAKELSIRVHVKDGAGAYEASSSTHNVRTETQGKDLVLSYAADNARPDQDFLLQLLPRGEAPRTQFATFASEGFNYLFCRLTPELQGQVSARPRQWIVLNDVSASRSKIDVAAQRYIVRRLAAEADDGDSLAVIDVNTAADVVMRLVPVQELRSAVADDGPLSIRHSQYPWPERPLLGATNFEAALQAAATLIREQRADNPHILYLGDGVATDGRTEIQALVGAMPAGATFIGIGVGKKVESRLLQAAADATGGMFATINPDEDIDWRVFDLVAALNTPRLTGVEIKLQDAAGRPIEATTYPSARSLSAGETLFVAARTPKQLPSTAILRGSANGKPFEQAYSLASAKTDGAYIPRFWAKQHIDELLKEGDRHQAEIERLSMQYYVVTPFTSLIVLEDDKMYEEFKVERGRKDHWALYPAPKEIPVVREEMEWDHWTWWGRGARGEDAKVQAKAKPQTVRDIVESVQFRINAPFYYSRPQRDDSAGRHVLYHLVNQKGRKGADPTRLLTYLYLLASGQAARAVNSGNQDAAAQGDHAGGVPGAPGQAAARGRRAVLMALDGWIVPGGGFEGQRGPLADGVMPLAPAFDVEIDRLPAGGKQFRLMQIFEEDYVEQAEAFKKLLLPSLEMPAGEAVSAGFDLSPMFRQLVQTEADGRRLRLPMLPGAEGGDLARDFKLRRELPPQLLYSYQQALATRWARINRDIRRFNRQYGYWSDWNDWGGEGLDLRDSANANWYGGLEGLLSSTQDGKESLPALSRYIYDESYVNGHPEGESFPAMGWDKLKKTPIALAWVSFLGQTMKSLPGTSSVLAGDHLIARRDELKRGQARAALSEAEKQELSAIEQALASLDTAAAKLESTAPFWSHRGWDYAPRPMTIEAPAVQVYDGYNWSYDLTSYAAGLYSTGADVLDEVVAQYGLPPAAGKVSAEAKRLIDAARAAIKPVTLRYGEGTPSVLAASGDRYALTRRTDMHLEERMVCNGGHVLHLYDELGLAARRSASALRLRPLRQLAPHFLEPAEELARLFDVEVAESNDTGFVLRLTPVIDGDAPKGNETHKGTEKLPDLLATLKVRPDGLLTHKALYADGKLVAQVVYEYTPQGGAQNGEPQQIVARWRDKDDKELAKVEFSAAPLADEKAFDVSLDDYVVVDMPLRKPSYYEQLLKALTEKDSARKVELLRHQALALIQELHWRRWYGSNTEAQKVLAEAARLLGLAGSKQKLGDLTLTGSCGAAVADVALEPRALTKAGSALRRYFHRHNESGAAIQKLSEEHPKTLVGHLAAYHAVVRNVGEASVFQWFVKDHAESPLLLAAAYHSAGRGSNPAAWYPLYESSRWRGAALLISAGQARSAEHLKRFDEALAAWYRDASGGAMGTAVLALPITSEIGSRLAGSSGFESIVKDQFERAKKAEGAAALLRLAELATTWGKKELAEQSLALARDRLKSDDSQSAKLALAQASWACGQTKEALRLYDEILAALKAKQLPLSAALLGATARLAAAAGDPARAIELEEAALAIEQEHLPDLVNLQAYRQRYSWLWDRLAEKVRETAGKDRQGMTSWLARAERAWHQWRQIDRENPHMIDQMATLQRVAGRNDQAWLYLSTLIDERPKDASSYASVAQWHITHSQLNEAQQYYAQAYRWDLANPQWLVERAQLLDRLGRKAEARQLYQQVVDGKWPPARQGYVEQAKKALN